MQVTVPYGPKEQVSMQIPKEAFYGMLEPPPLEPLQDPASAIADAIEHPIGGQRLEELIAPGKRVAIICDDLSRPTPVSTILPVLLDKLGALGTTDADITVIMALGSHRYMTEEELRQRVGDDIYRRCRVVNSEFKDEENLISLGTTEDGVNIVVTREAMAADIRIGIGNIVPHPVMGWSGGGKILFPGVTGEHTVAQFHMLGGLANENLYGKEDCHIRLRMEQWVDVIGLHFVINTVLTTKLELYRVVAGHYVDAQREGVKHAKRSLGCRMRQKADIIVVSSFPADFDFWQSGKGICSAEHGLKNSDGTIILVSPNFEGVGPHLEYVDYFGRDDAEEELLKLYRGEPVQGDPLALSVGTSMSKLRRRANLVVVTDGMTQQEVEASGCAYYHKSQLQQALDDAMARYQNPVVAVASHGGELYLYS